MNLEEYRTLFLITTISLSLIVAAPALYKVFPSQDASEDFVELWLLGSDHMIQNYPVDVETDQTNTFYLGVNNRMGSPEHYKIAIKMRTPTQALSDESGVPSSLPVLNEYRVFLDNNDAWESTVTFQVKDVSENGETLSAGTIRINGLDFPVDASTNWDSEDKAYYFQLFFELWQYDTTVKDFVYTDQFVYIWLNVAAPLAAA